ncbi:MAG: hypothetical protein QXF17_01340 [Ignisphaera sp.]
MATSSVNISQPVATQPVATQPVATQPVVPPTTSAPAQLDLSTLLATIIPVIIVVMFISLLTRQIEETSTSF